MIDLKVVELFRAFQNPAATYQGKIKHISWWRDDMVNLLRRQTRGEWKVVAEGELSH